MEKSKVNLEPFRGGNSQNIDYSRIPEACIDLHSALRDAGFPVCNLKEEILAEDNLAESFDYVVAHLEEKEQREKYKPHKEQLIDRLRKELDDETFFIGAEDFQEMDVEDGQKKRKVQAPKVYYRIGCHAVMVVVERYLYPTLVTNTAACIKGKGMHWLFHIIEEDYLNTPEQMRFFLKNDVEHFYDSIQQQRLKEEIRHYISCPFTLRILDNFITLLPDGISKGLRASQCFANIFLSPVDHYMCCFVESYTMEDGTVRYLYQRYMDDTEMWSGNKRKLWELREIHHEQMRKQGLSIKASEAIRPVTEGSDFLGFIFYGTHSSLRKHTKKKAARKLAKVKSRKRRQEIIGSFKGMACHADCKHLYLKLTSKYMKKFSEMGVVYQPEDGKKRFPGKVVPIRNIVNMPIEIHDFESGMETKNGDGRYLVSYRDVQTGTWGKFFTASKEIKNILDQISDIEEGFPFETTMTIEVADGKTIPKFN